MTVKKHHPARHSESSLDLPERPATALNNFPPEKFDGARRRLIKKTGVGALASLAVAQLPEKWRRPVVESVVLPVHAQTSPTTTPPMFVDSILIEDPPVSFSRLFLLFDRSLDTVSVPTAAAFEPISRGMVLTVTDIRIFNDPSSEVGVVELNFSPAVSDEDAFTIEYMKPTEGDVLRGIDGGEVERFGPNSIEP